MDFTVYEAQSTRELVPPAETRQSLPSLVYTKTIDVGKLFPVTTAPDCDHPTHYCYRINIFRFTSGNYIEVEITCTIVNYQDSKLTILFVATRP